MSGRYLKEITSSSQIHNHQLNFSPTKQQYSFSHASRFKASINKATIGVGFYDVNEKMYKHFRSTSLGKGNKYNFTSGKKGIPASNTYFPKNRTIEKNDSSKYSFGLSRDKISQNSIMSNLKNSKCNPGPGTYNPSEIKTGRCVSMHIRTNKLNKSMISLGPGQYNIPSTIQIDKKLPLSKNKSTFGIKFAPISVLDEKTKERIKTARDGVNKQNLENKDSFLSRDKKYQINKFGNYYNTKYKNSKCGRFGKENRYGYKKNKDVPGPGNYLLPSDFGIYQSSTATSRY